jgi:SEC-C motif-containing protein
MATTVTSTAPCPCTSSRSYGECCEPFLSGKAKPPTAEALMRSRYSAYVLRLEPYLLATWHASTRPVALNLAAQPAIRWLGLTVKRHVVVDADHATVEFVARSRSGGGRAQRLHEISRFVREDGRWYYLDGAFEGHHRI